MLEMSLIVYRVSFYGNFDNSSCQIWKLNNLKVDKIESWQNWILPKLKFANIENFQSWQNWILPKLKFANIENFQSWQTWKLLSW